MPAQFNEYGVQFSYPENWTLEQTPGGDGELPADVTLQTPGGGFWSMQLLPSAVSPEECVDQVISELRGEYDDLELEVPTAGGDETLPHGREVRFFCLDLLVEARIWACRVPGHTLVGHYQAVQSEFEAIGPVFRAINASLFQENLGI